MVKEETSTKLVPPYLSVARLDALLKLLESHSFPKITVGDLVARNFSKPDGFLAIQTLRFLGMLSVDGKPTDKAKVLSMKAEGKEQKLQEIVRVAYQKLFDTVPSAELLSRAQLHDEFMAVYGISSRLANSATPLFIWLCNKAAIKTTEEIKQTKARSKTSYRSATVKGVVREHRENYAYRMGGNDIIDLNISSIRLLIPKNEIVDDAIASGGLIDVRQEIIKFAEKVGLKSIRNGEAEEPGEKQ